MAIERVESYRDNETNKFVSKEVGRSAFKSAMNPSAIQPMQGPTEPNEQTGLMLGVLSGMKSSLDELVSLTKESLGLDKKENNRELLDARNEKLKGGQTDPVEKKGFEFGSFLETLKDAFGKVKEKFRIGDKLKLLLLATGLLALGKYSEQIITFLTPVLRYFKKVLIPKLRSFADYFKKFSEIQTESFEDEFGNMKQRTTGGDPIGIDMAKVRKAFAIGLAGYLTLKFLPSILWTVGGVLLRIPGIGLAVGVIGLGAYLIWSAIKKAGQAVVDSAGWTKEKGATDDSTANAVGAFFGGEMKGSFKNAISNAGYWGKTFGLIGMTIGLFGGPLGIVAGGVLGFAIGAIFGGILGLIGGGFIAKTYKFIQDSIIKMIDFTKEAMLEQEYIAQKRVKAAAFKRDNEGATEEEIMAALGFTPDMRGYEAQKTLIFKNQAFGIDDDAPITEIIDQQQKIAETIKKSLDFSITPLDMSLIDGRRAVEGKIIDVDRRLKQQIARKDAIFAVGYDTDDPTAVAEMGEIINSIGQLESDRKRLEDKLKFQAGSNYGTRGATSLDQMYEGRDAAPGNISTGPLEITVPQPAAGVRGFKPLLERPEVKNKLLISELNNMIPPTVVQLNKGGNVTSENLNQTMAFNKMVIHDDVTIDILAGSR